MSPTFTYMLFCIVLALFFMLSFASEPELTTDYFVPSGKKADSDYFTYTGLRNLTTPAAGAVGLGPVFQAQFPPLQGLGLSYVSFDFQPGSVVPPHHHPRGNELIYIIEGCMEAGFVDSTNKLFSKTLSKGDLFVFPIGLIHYQVNPTKYKTKAISALSSSNPGLIFTPNALLGSGIPTGVLAKSLKVSNKVITQLKAALAA